MVDKAQRRLKAVAVELGISRRAAGNIMAQRRPPRERGYGHQATATAAAVRTEPLPVELANLLAELRAVNTFAVLTGRVPAAGGSTTYSVAQAQAVRLMNNPQWYAETGAGQKGISRELHEKLLHEGAADDTKSQMIRSFHAEQGHTFSERCSRCRRWIWCGDREFDGRCICGAAYRIVFDLPEVEHWSQRREWLCMDCGKEQQQREWVGPRQPWHLVNARQAQCDPCYQKQPTGADFEHVKDQQLIIVTEPEGREVYRGAATQAQAWHLHNCGYSVTCDGWALTSNEMNTMLLGGRTRAVERGHRHLLVASERKGNPFLIGTASASTPEGLQGPGYTMLASVNFKRPVGMHIERYVNGQWKVELTYYFADP